MREIVGVGLPPRVRGVALFQLPRRRLTGLTPAGAGSGLSWIFGRLPFKAYPRGCGEWGVLGGDQAYSPGLPPRVRGVGDFDGTNGQLVGLTPAGAGSGATARPGP